MNSNLFSTTFWNRL